ncbi:MAG: DUF4325 domain-containing protein [Candidatus Krumholzibacteriota bacterium]|nr:DUF4325 domain-containing protein [Candidatus Krumholzibacteriota bacterium]
MVRKKNIEIVAKLLTGISLGQERLVSRVARFTGVTRQTVNTYLRQLIAEGTVIATGNTRGRRYQLARKLVFDKTYDLRGLEEHVVWEQDLRPHLEHLPPNVLGIWLYGINEMINNAIDHSEGTTVQVAMAADAVSITVHVEDDGIGIFRKIQQARGLEDERASVLELSKGKLTTDPSTHTGEGIFFTSRMFDDFLIVSGEVAYTHFMKSDLDWVFQREKVENGGTIVTMIISTYSTRTTEKVFNEFTGHDTAALEKTVVPVELLKYGSEELVSRSQARRLMSGVEGFRTVVLDFNGIARISRAFADQVFRVFQEQHPEITIVPINTNKRIKRLIEHARSNARPAQPSTEKGEHE